MHDLMESLTGAYTEEYSLHAGSKPSLKRVWTYEDEPAFLNDVEKLARELGQNFYLSSWRIENGKFSGMKIFYRVDIALSVYIDRKRMQIQQGAEIESEEE